MKDIENTEKEISEIRRAIKYISENRPQKLIEVQKCMKLIQRLSTEPIVDKGDEKL